MTQAHPIPQSRRKGRAAGSNPANRFDRLHAEAEHDGWDIAEDLPPLRTEVRVERPRQIVTKNASPDIGFDRSVNPYRGCEHGCIYCYARPSHAFLGLSPGLDFETRLIARPEAAARLDAELRRPAYRPRTIAIGTNTDPYQPIERDWRIMRQVLEVLSAFRHPVTVVTKGALIERDADILGEMGKAGLARAGISITTLDPGLARRMEPRCPSPARRLRTVETLARAGCPVRVMASPIVPGLTDHELEAILKAARDAGAVAASTIALRLPREVSGLWRDWLAEHYPDRLTRVMSKLRDMHGGRDYDATWGARMTGRGVWADLIQARFERARKALGLAKNLPPLRCDCSAHPRGRWPSRARRKKRTGPLRRRLARGRACPKDLEREGYNNMKIIVYAIAAALLSVRLPRALPTLRLLTLAFALCVGGGVQAQTETVTIPDANLRGVLEAELNKQAGAPITRAEMRSLRILGATSSNIADLTGLEHATGLILLQLSNSSISDLSPLRGLTGLTWLHLGDNSISDLSPLRGLTGLTWLDLHGNSISDIAPLATNTGLGSGDTIWLGFNPLNAAAYDIHIPALRARGADVRHTPHPARPAVSVALAAGVTEPVSGPFRIVIAFSEPVTGFGLSDLDVTGGTASALQGSGAAYTATVTPTDGFTGFLTVNVAVNVAQDAAGNGNTAAARLQVTTVPPDPVIVTIPDANLRGVLEAELNKQAGAPITRAEMRSLQILVATSWNIADLTGLEHATGLILLQLSNNSIADLSPLRGLTGLRWLSLVANSIADLSPLRGLTGLTALDLAHNRISDIAPLAANTGLGSGDAIWLEFNPLNAAAYDTHIPALRARGADVGHTPRPDRPAVSVALAAGVTEPVSGPFRIVIAFSEPVTGFGLSDLDVTGGTASALQGSGATYTATVTPTDGFTGFLTLNVAANVAQDAVGNGNTASMLLSVWGDTAPVAALVSEFLLGRADALARAQPRLTRLLDDPANDQNLGLSFGADGDGARRGRIDGAFVRGPLWGEIGGSWSESTTDTATTDSHYILGTLGAHWRAGETWLVGAMLQLDTMAEDLSKDGATGRIEGRGWLIGPYAVGRPWGTPATLEARLLTGRSSNDLTYTPEAHAPRAGAFDSTRWLAQLRVEGDVPLAWGTLTPYADGTWTRDSAADFTTLMGGRSSTVPAQSVTLGQLDLGADIAVPLATDTGALTLTAGAGVVFSHRDAGAGDEDRVPSARGTLDLGLDYRLDDSLTATLEATHDGLGASAYRTTGLTLGLDWRF